MNDHVHTTKSKKANYIVHANKVKNTVHDDPNVVMKFRSEIYVNNQITIKNDKNSERIWGRKQFRNLKICIGYTKYDSIRRVSRDFGFREVGEKDHWNLYWTDGFIGLDKIITLKEYQVLNHFPGMVEICRKDLLARNINRMLKLFHNDYNFCPKTWCLPSDILDFEVYCRNHKDQSFIVKPEASCQGKGIILTQNIDELRTSENMVGQVYVKNPLLMDGYKFDLRIYVLITSIDPLRLYVYNEGLVRLTTVKYEKPNRMNLHNVLMHLTNYSLQKTSNDFKQGEVAGTKRRISVFTNWLRKQGYDTDKLWKDIDDVIIKTIISIYQQLKQNYKNSFPNHTVHSAAFELLGFDILLTTDMKPLLLEVNHSPSFHTDASIDMEVKDPLIWDTFQILNLKPITRSDILQASRDSYKRLNFKFNRTNLKAMKKARFDLELQSRGNFRLVYPTVNTNIYDKYLNSSISLFTETVSYRARLRIARKLRQKIRYNEKKNISSVRQGSKQQSDISDTSLSSRKEGSCTLRSCDDEFLKSLQEPIKTSSTLSCNLDFNYLQCKKNFTNDNSLTNTTVPLPNIAEIDLITDNKTPCVYDGEMSTICIDSNSNGSLNSKRGLLTSSFLDVSQTVTIKNKLELPKIQF